MNRFRAKKNKDESSPRPSQDSEFAMPSFFKKTKKPVEETPQIDIAAALPTNDDFRTSLLMSGLSARFSMLREQDDPSSKIGKASDDSVLFPNRQSRLDFGLSRDLGDIAEVESIKRPFARQESFVSSDDAASITSGSIMGRSRQTEGNNLFGGRQKIYKIPAGATSKSNAVGGMPGRALYDDDVAMSAFQRWRMEEKGRKSSEGESDGNDEDEQDDLYADMPRSVSPAIPGYNRNRDTSSTMSSIPSMARNSTAATSIISNQRTPSFKENQSALPSSNTTNSTPTPASTVTRTRRLYEQALTQDLQENQSSALSRFESVGRQRALGSRTPDVGQGIVPSPTLSAYSERLGGGRSVLAKASAPNLRSMSPPVTTSSVGTPDLSYRAPGQSENRSFLGGGTPPLSPPISESEDTSLLPIQPNDRGKATALGVFQKPSQGYDESRFAQRQLQLQQGRETPTNRERTDSSASYGSAGPNLAQRSASTTKPAPSTTTQHPLHEEQSTFFMDDNASEISAKSPEIDQSAAMDQHPAFRSSAEPAGPSRNLAQSAKGEAHQESEVDERGDPLDSPTLPLGAGLSGMVRQHLRAVSNTSSVYTAEPGMADSDNEEDVRQISREHKSNWPQDRLVPAVGHTGQNSIETFMSINDFGDDVADSIPRESLDRDDFANQLADGARRIRERLTLYQDNDSRSTSPYPVPEPKESMDAGSSSKATGLGILRSRDSRGSMRERGRDESQSKAMRMLGLGSRGTSPASMKYQTESSPPLQPVQSIAETEEPRPTSEGSTKSVQKEEHAGLRAFRQARRELQKMKELEAQNRHHAGQEPHDSPPRGSGASNMAENDQSMPVRRPFDEPSQRSYLPGSRSTSRGDRDRSGSESSHGQRSQSRQGRFRQNSDLDHAASPRADGLRPQIRIPVGLPTSPHPMNRSPMGLPQQHPGSPARTPQNQPGSGSLHPSNSRGFASGQPSPISPMPSPFMSSGPNTSNGWDRDGRSESGLPRVRPREPSDPHLREQRSYGNMPRMNGAGPSHAPPLPPINPRRRQESSRESSRTRTMYDSPGRQSDDKHGPVSSASTPDLFGRAEQSRDGSLMGRRPAQQKFTPTDFSARPRDNTPPFNVGPPASRMVVAPSRSPGNGRPGGMI